MIALRKVTRRFGTGEGSVEALRAVDLEINRGELVTVTGPSGSGKTTLLQILGTLDAPDEGEYLLEGNDIARLPDRETSRIRNRHFGFVFQSYNLLPDCTALENVMMPLVYAGLSRPERRERATRLLDTVGLAGRAHHYPSMLSGGEQQRVAIARALVGNPSLVLADEPTGNLPSETGKEILRLFLDLHETGATFVIVTHDPAVAAFGARRIHMEDGRIVA
jgi:putative ABC transport system ATP-binding protein